MDIEQVRKYAKDKVLAGSRVSSVRQVLKDERYEKQDQYEGVSEVYKPLIDSQKLVKEAVDESQDKLIKQLQEGQDEIII